MPPSRKTKGRAVGRDPGLGAGSGLPRIAAYSNNVNEFDTMANTIAESKRVGDVEQRDWDVVEPDHQPVPFNPPTSPRRRPTSPTHFRKERSPTPLPEAVEPSPIYLALSEKASSTHPHPPSRKLLILDLNGTLVYRSGNRGTVYPGGVRPSHPRPYMSSFRDYLFHPKTKEWLDSMVWSSAQPHSVADMVRSCFGAEEVTPTIARKDEVAPVDRSKDGVLKKRNLVAIWARDTLGLSQRAYVQKTQTYKDLAKPWSLLPPHSLHLEPGSTKPQAHSALTTLLVDDSPLKAKIQPWNHVCVKEYDSELWTEAMQAKRFADASLAAAKPPVESSAEIAPTEAIEAADIAESAPEDASEARKKKRKRKKKKKAVESMDQGFTDPTLLSLVAVLETLKFEDNVAGWIRSGGLWAGMRTERLTGQDSNSSPHSADVSGGSDVPSSSPHPPSSQPPSSDPIFVDDSPTKKRQSNSSTLDTLLRKHSEAREDWVSNAGNDKAVHVQNSPATSLMWFESEEVMEYWAEKGRIALERLGITVDDGIVPL
ncbi:hypothetical protein SISSUDRAFT_1052458 [Sistotremastrum suecicum HHB10207 ss-3]|uniref:Mitochondrial import inner membrane translocase subunit TIM50 n=1 Tax=Sistotremastrum suecicum HHB10207 ss-3 TaxID=1314776 RepID=A0A165ZUV8_9AGAM|nr:hypothetical protein SISSUDRAFT_1052458 [Sistotremastrum suecicum HHB10207 ss-3]